MENGKPVPIGVMFLRFSNMCYVSELRKCELFSSFYLIPDNVELTSERKKDVELLVLYYTLEIAACNANVVKVMFAHHFLFAVENM